MIVFDMAGTVVDEDNVVYKTLRTAINEHGYQLTLDQVLAEGAGREKQQAIRSILQRYAGKSDEVHTKKIYDAFVLLLAKAYHNLEVKPQPHTLELFQALRNKQILVALDTGYNKETAQLLIDKLGWEKGVHYDTLITASDVSSNRPDPDMILLAMKQFNITDGRTVVKVGDSMIDVEEGKNAGCGMTVGITTGAHSLKQLASASPDYIIHDLLELIPLL